MSRFDKPVRACGCINADDEQTIHAVLVVLRAIEAASNGAVVVGGFTAESRHTNDDGSVTTRTLAL